jgi:hypothetical protein
VSSTTGITPGAPAVHLTPREGTAAAQPGGHTPSFPVPYQLDMADLILSVARGAVERTASATLFPTATEADSLGPGQGQGAAAHSSSAATPALPATTSTSAPAGRRSDAQVATAARSQPVGTSAQVPHSVSLDDPATLSALVTRIAPPHTSLGARSHTHPLGRVSCLYVSPVVTRAYGVKVWHRDWRHWLQTMHLVMMLSTAPGWRNHHSSVLPQVGSA